MSKNKEKVGELTERVEELSKGEVLVQGSIEMCDQLTNELGEDETYLALIDAYKESGEDISFNRFLGTIVVYLEAVAKVAEGEAKTKIERFSKTLENIRQKFCEQNRPYFTYEIDKYILKMKKSIRYKSEDFYKRLGLEDAEIKRPAEIFLELAMRRELSVNDWKDDLQETYSRYIKVLPNRSIGPMEIQPRTYARALLFKNGIESTGEYETDIEIAIARGLIRNENDLIYTITNSDSSLNAFQDILTMYIPKRGEPVEVLVDKGDGLKSYFIPVRDKYLFSTRENQRIKVNYDELRLMVALAKYQGRGLRFLSPDKEVKVNGDEIVLEEKLVLNNTITDICIT